MVLFLSMMGQDLSGLLISSAKRLPRKPVLMVLMPIWVWFSVCSMS